MRHPTLFELRGAYASKLDVTFVSGYDTNMNFWSPIIGLLLMGCLIGGPVFVFAIKLDAPQWQKYTKLLLPVFLLAMVVGLVSSFP